MRLRCHIRTYQKQTGLPQLTYVQFAERAFNRNGHIHKTVYSPRDGTKAKPMSLYNAEIHVYMN